MRDYFGHQHMRSMIKVVGRQQLPALVNEITRSIDFMVQFYMTLIYVTASYIIRTIG
jgi:hypothetical protein